MRALFLASLAVLLVLLGGLPAGGSPGAVNGRIAFTRSGVLGGTEVWTMNQDGSDLRRLTSGHDPAWSPDGTRLVLVDGDSRLVVIRADGTDAQALDVTGGPAFLASPAWSPNGAAIAFAGERPNGLYVVPAAGGTPRVIVPGYNPAPAWSPDGKQIAFIGVAGAVNVVDADGSRLQSVPEARSPGGRVSWAPDGSRIAFGDSRTGGISTVRLDGSAPVPLVVGVTTRSYNPSWSPDGARIAFDNQDICVVNADGTGLGRLTYAPYDEVFSRGSGNGGPAWQPLPPGTPPAGAPVTPPGPSPDWDRNLSWPWACSLQYKGRALTETVTPARARVGGLVTYRLRLQNRSDVPIGEQGLAAFSGALDGGARVVSVTVSQGGCRATPNTDPAELPLVEIDCLFGALFPGEAATVTLRVRATAPGELQLAASLPVPLAAGDGTDASGDDLLRRTPVAGCTRRGTERADVIAGSARADALCGLDGNDRIRGRAGSDSVYAGPGDDTILVRDRERDRVSCGSGEDSVVADPVDGVGQDCEHASRR